MSAPLEREVAVFNAARQLPAEEQSAYLDAQCASDATLRQRVEELLQVGAASGDFLEQPAQAELGAALAAGSAIPESLPLSEKVGDKIDRFKLLQQIGEGGCGVVYMAAQEEPIRRQVALKVIKLGMDTKQVIARFEAERQALALMDHPNIARVLDAGATETGRPYFVMELVKGIKITEFCDQESLTMRQRLDLFMQVCHAIQHAHQKGVIHRDIKPSNILVTVNDGVPVPKVIDFGIAKATTGSFTDQTLFTAFGQFLGTPTYMSPEQAVLSSLGVDTRTDIYSLGVLLYELLTGQTPFDAKTLLQAGWEAMRQTILEQEPARPSAKLSTLEAGALATAARLRGAEPPRLIHLLRGDLDWIVMKCLEKDPNRRFESANGLARDVERHLKDQPIVARPPSTMYRIQKTIRRNKFVFAGIAAVIGMLIAGICLSVHLTLKGNRAREDAVLISSFLTDDLLGQATPDQNERRKKVTMEDVLVVAEQRLDTNFRIAAHPEAEAALRTAIAKTYFKLALLKESERNQRRALGLFRKALGPLDANTLDAEDNLAWILIVGHSSYEEAAVLSRAAWQARVGLLGQDDRATLASMHTYINAITDTLKSEEAEQLARKCLQLRERKLGPDDPDTIMSLTGLGYLLGEHGHWGEAETVLVESQRRQQRTNMPSVSDAVSQAIYLGRIYLMEGKLTQGETLLKAGYERALLRFGPDDGGTQNLQLGLGRVYYQEGKFDLAEIAASNIVEICRRTSPDADTLANGLELMGVALIEKNQPVQAEVCLKEALATFRARKAMKLTMECEFWLGAIQADRGEYTQAESPMLAYCEALLAHRSPPIFERSAIQRILRLYKACGNSKSETEWRKKLDALPPDPAAATR